MRLRRVPATTRSHLALLLKLGWLLAVSWLVATGLSDPARASEIAVLKSSSDIAAYNQAVKTLKAELPASVTVTEYDLQGDVARGQKLARKVRASDAAAVVAVGLKAALVAKLEIVDVPVIFCMVLDPARYDLRAPNLIGISLQIPIERQFDTIRAILPKATRVGVLYDPDKTGGLVEDARRTGKSLGIALIERQVRAEKQVPAVLRELLPQIEALWLVPDSTILTEDSLRFVLSTALDHNVPVAGFSPEFVRNGALLGLSVSPVDIGKQAGVLAKKILQGEAPPSQASVPPERVRLAINLKIAKFLGVTLPPEVVSRADDVY